VYRNDILTKIKPLDIFILTQINNKISGGFMLSNLAKSITDNKIHVKKYSEIAMLFRYKRDFLDILSNRYMEIAKAEPDYFAISQFQKWSVKLYNCFNTFTAAIYSNNIQKIFKAQTCQDRLCPACNHRRMLRTSAKLIQIYQSEQMSKYRYLHVVLTVVSCTPAKLTETIDKLLYDFDKFLKNKRIKAINKGFFRSLEITYNVKDKTFHPHIHGLFVVNPSYFSDMNIYLKQSDFVDIWQSSTNDPKITQVSVQALKKGDMSGIIEVSKYAVKVSEQLIKSIPLEDLKILRLNLFKRRLVSMGGIIRKVAAELKLNLDDDNELTDSMSDDDIRKAILLYLVDFAYRRKSQKLHVLKKEAVGF
jgi:plasmid rolling circle replication initiator protein Rep